MPEIRKFVPFDVLVVDDEPDVRDLLGEFLRGHGCDVASAADGRAAITAIERDPGRFGLILTDLQLPGADGLAVLQAARTASAVSHVVIITGYASLDSAIQAVRLGAYDYLTKPFSLGQIELLLQRVTDRLALEAENRQMARQIDERVSAEGMAGLTRRLDAIEAGLQRLDVVLREIRDSR